MPVKVVPARRFQIVTAAFWLLVCGCLKVPLERGPQGLTGILDTFGQCNSGLMYA